MPAHKILPEKSTLELWLREGLTHAEMAEKVYQTTGHRVSRSTISVAIHRAGLSETRTRHREEIPWRLKGKDLVSYPVRMLRLLARQRAGEGINDEEVKRLQNWLTMLEEENAVVAYDPDSTPSIFYIERQPEDPVDIPIHVQRVWLNPARR